MDIISGRVVRIKDDISHCYDYVSEMGEFQGKEVTIKDVWCEGEFTIEEDPLSWKFYKEMIQE